MQQRDSDRYVVFSMNDEFFGVPILQVREVVKNPRICPVPHTIGSFDGVIQCRDAGGTRIVSVVDLSELLGIERSSSSTGRASGVALIVEMAGTSGTRMIGARVDGLIKIAQYKEGAIHRDPGIETLIPEGKLLGIASDGDHLVQIIDVAAILSDRNFAVQKPIREAA